MKAAILLSSYNGEKYIRQQIDSILAQQCHVPFDLWVRDDGSTDSTHSILEDYAREGKLQWYTGENLRSAKSFLDLILHCPGYDYYAFADQDDYWQPDKLSRGVAQLQDPEIPSLYFANARLVGSQLEDLGRDVYKQNPYEDYHTLLCQGGLLGCTMIFNGALARLVREAPQPQALIMHDFYVAAVCALFDGQILYDPTAVMLYRQHSNNVVGVSRGKLGALKSRFQQITRKEPISIAQQAASMLACYPGIPDGEKLAWLKKVANYRNSFFSALSLALSGKTRYCNKNKAITLRLALLMRNR